jgi:hypothetical protein
MPQVWIGHYPSLLLRPFLFHKYALAGLNATDGGRVDYSRVEASGRASCPLPDHCRAAADVALYLELKAARVGPFPIEVPAKYADEYDA